MKRCKNIIVNVKLLSKMNVESLKKIEFLNKKFGDKIFSLCNRIS
jgi:hypothetical protein